MSSISNKQLPKNVNTTITVLFTFLAVGFVYFTFNAYEDINQYLIFNDAKFKSSTQKIKILTSIAFYSSLLIISLFFLKFLSMNLLNRAANSPFVEAIGKLTTSQLEQFAIFIGIYAHVLFQGDLQKKVLILIPFWFLFARFMQIIGTLIQMQIIYNVRQFGIVLSTFINILMICEIFQFSLLAYFAN